MLWTTYYISRIKDNDGIRSKLSPNNQHAPRHRPQKAGEASGLKHCQMFVGRANVLPGTNCRTMHSMDSKHVSQQDSVIYQCAAHSPGVHALDLRAGLSSDRLLCVTRPWRESALMCLEPVRCMTSYWVFGKGESLKWTRFDI